MYSDLIDFFDKKRMCCVLTYWIKLRNLCSLDLIRRATVTRSHPSPRELWAEGWRCASVKTSREVIRTTTLSSR